MSAKITVKTEFGIVCVLQHLPSSPDFVLSSIAAKCFSVGNFSNENQIHEFVDFSSVYQNLRDFIQQASKSCFICVCSVGLVWFGLGWVPWRHWTPTVVKDGINEKTIYLTSSLY